MCIVFLQTEEVEEPVEEDEEKKDEPAEKKEEDEDDEAKVNTLFLYSFSNSKGPALMAEWSKVCR